MSSVIGNKIKLSVFGESHGEAIGCVIDGLPCGIKLDFDEIKREMARRAPGNDKTATARRESDTPVVLSGMLNDRTTGAPLAMEIKNTNTRSGDYGNLMSVPRPSHSDYPAYVKYHGNAPIVFAGAVAKQILKEKGIAIGAHISRIGSACDNSFDMNCICEAELDAVTHKQFAVINDAVEAEMRACVEAARINGDSIGGSIECAAIGLPVGLGGNMFDTIESRLSAALFGIPAVKGVQFGAGFGFAEMLGSEANDGYEIRDGKIALLSNNNGGVLGGMSSGAPVVFSVALKPTPSISLPQKSVNLQTMENEMLVVKGRHDPCIVPRAVPVIEGITAVTLLDLMM